MKSIQYEENLDGRTADTRWRYNMALPQKDTEDKHRKNTKKILVDTESTTKNNKIKSHRTATLTE